MKRMVVLSCFAVVMGVVGSGCPPTACTAVGCAENMSWSASLPEGITFEEALALSVRACRNEVCFERGFEDIGAEPLAPNMGRGMTLSETELHDGVETPVGDTYVTATLFATPGGYDVEVRWNDAAVADGDAYVLTALGAEGEAVLRHEAPSVEYVVSHPNGPDCPGVCRTVSLEGSTQ
jgi:hypothetical protein